MEKLALCSKVLYDKDVINKSKELLKYKKQIEFSIEFKTFDDYDKSLNSMYSEIEKCVKKWLNDTGHYVFWDVDTIYTDGVSDTLTNCLENLTKSKEWSSYNSFHIILSIEAMLDSLNHTFGLFSNDLNNRFSPTILTKLVTDSIKYQLSESGGDGYLNGFVDIAEI